MIIFNNKQLPDWISVTGITFQYANLSIIEHDAKRRIGTIDAGVDRNGITINLELFIEPVEKLSILEQADVLKRFLMGNNWKVSRLILSEQPNKFYNARVSNAGELTDNFTHGKNSISFYCADPKKYDVEETIVTSSNGELKIDYEGLENSSVQIEIDVVNKTKNLEIKQIETGKKITILGDFTSGQKVIIDTDLRSIKLDGINIKNKMAFESNWLFLESGTNAFSCSSPDKIMNEFKIKYRKAD